MDSIVDRARSTGISLGGPNRSLPARLDFRRLNKRAKDLGRVLVAVFSTESGDSVSPCDEFETFRMIRRSKAALTIEYFAVERSLAIGL